MSTTNEESQKRTYGVRIVSHPKVQKALNMEQSKRHAAVNYEGPEPRKIDILADWVEEKADTIIEGTAK